MAKLGRYSADRKKVRDLTAGTYNLAANDCGTIFTLNSSTGGAIAINLPKASVAGNGWWAKFVISADPHDNSHTITKASGDSNNIYLVSSAVSGTVYGQAAGAHSSGSADDVITFVTDKATIGDQVELVCDGTNYYATAFIYAYDGLTSA